MMKRAIILSLCADRGALSDFWGVTADTADKPGHRDAALKKGKKRGREGEKNKEVGKINGGGEKLSDSLDLLKSGLVKCLNTV